MRAVLPCGAFFRTTGSRKRTISLVLPFPFCYNPAVDGVKQHKGRQQGDLGHGTPQTRFCRYCKAKFDVDPKHPNKEFCLETHRKLFWRYGQHSVEKVARRMERSLRKWMDVELKKIRRECGATNGADDARLMIDTREIEGRLAVLESRVANISAAACGRLVGA